jgi:hypothetical protein
MSAYGKLASYVPMRGLQISGYTHLSVKDYLPTTDPVVVFFPDVG